MPEEIITGPKLNNLTDAELQRRIKTVNIFCRVMPEQKLRLVNAFKSNGDIVVMTGDGVNDAPARKCRVDSQSMSLAFSKNPVWERAKFGRSKFNSEPRRTEIYAESCGIFLWFV
jgi:hypothetical protein